MENYRPISLLSTLPKVFERVVFEQIYAHLNSNNLLYQSQYGFRKDHSTEMASAEFPVNIARAPHSACLPHRDVIEVCVNTYMNKR